jgi:hypothetical protein
LPLYGGEAAVRNAGLEMTSCVVNMDLCRSRGTTPALRDSAAIILLLLSGITTLYESEPPQL